MASQEANDEVTEEVTEREPEDREAPMRDRAEVQCPYCFEWVEIDVDPQTRGQLVEDCQVCCNPWQVRIERDREGELSVEVERLQ